MEYQRGETHGEIYALVDKIKSGDRDAFMTVSRLYQKKVYLLAYSYFRNSEDAMDIVQETFLRLYQKVNTYHPERNFQNWLLQIAKNLCIDYYRKHYGKNKEFKREKSLEELNTPVADKDISHNSSDLKDIFAVCIDRLTERQRMIFVMRHYNNLDYKEISQILNISVGTVKSLHFKAVKNLRILMTPYLEDQS
jgi:RNA polymerase sigma-70 factor (ECF subfamily)